MTGVPDDAEQSTAHALALADSAWAELFGPRREATFDRLDREYALMRRALDALLESGDGERAERLIQPLREFWWNRGRMSEGLELIERVLALLPRERPDVTRAALLDHAGALAVAQNDPSSARVYFETALTIRRTVGTQAEVASSLHHLASLLRWKLGDTVTARGLYEEALSHACSANNQLLTAAALMPLGALALDRGATREARGMLTEGLRLFAAARVQASFPVALEQFAALAVAEGQHTRALRLAAAGQAQRERLGTTQWPEMSAWTTRWLALARQAVPAEAVARAWSDGYALPLADAVAYALDESSCAWTCETPHWMAAR